MCKPTQSRADRFGKYLTDLIPSGVQPRVWCHNDLCGNAALVRGVFVSSTTAVTAATQFTFTTREKSGDLYIASWVISVLAAAVIWPLSLFASIRWFQVCNCFHIYILKKCRCCNKSIICSTYNPDALRATRISEVQGHVRQCSEGHGAETYMGVLSLQRWRGGKWLLISYQGTTQTHTHTYTVNTVRRLIIMHSFLGKPWKWDTPAPVATIVFDHSVAAPSCNHATGKA